MEKNSFVIYTDIMETLNELTDDQVGKLFRAMVEYVELNKKPKFKGSLRLAFIPIRQQIDRDMEKWNQIKSSRSEAGRRGGIVSGASRSKRSNEAIASNVSAVENPRSAGNSNRSNEANEAVNVNVNVNVNEDVNVINSDTPPFVSSVIEYLNEQTGSTYDVTDEVACRLTTLEAAGYGEDDFQKVIDTKVAEWKDDPKMRRFLRPSTLFGPKFSEYVAQPLATELIEAEQRKTDRDELIAEREQLKADYQTVDQQLKTIETDGYEKHINEWHELDTKRWALEKNIENLNIRIARLEG